MLPGCFPEKGFDFPSISFEENDVCFLLQGRSGQVTTDWEKKTMGDSWAIPATRLGRITFDWEKKTMGDSWVIPNTRRGMIKLLIGRRKQWVIPG